MAGAITMQGLIDASLDSDTLEAAVNEDKIITARLGREFASVPMASRLLVENGLLGATPFSAKSSMTASAAGDGSYAIVTNDSTSANNGFYQKIAGSWVFLKWNPASQMQGYVDLNPLFKPQRLESTTVINNIKLAGIYHVPTAAIATSLGLPDAAEGQLYVSGNTQADDTGYVFQTYINKNGNTYQRVNIGSSWTAWSGNYIGIASFNKNLNDFTEKGTYHAFTSGMATIAKNYPFTGAGGILTVMNDDGIIRQNYVSNKGTAQRFGITSNGVTTWQSWVGVEYDSTQIAKMATFLKEGSQAYKVVTNISEISGNLNSLIAPGSYFVNSGTVASTANGFPITGSGGFLDVKVNASDAVHQRWTNINGYAYRWGAISGGVATWQPWRGVKNDQNGVIDLNTTSSAKQKIVVYGSSTMEYLADELQEMSSRKNLDLRSHGISGDILGGAGQAQGSNVVEISFPNGAIGYNTPVPIIVTSSFGEHARHNRSVTLSNGVKGTMYTNNTFQAVNLTSDLPVPTTEKYRVTEPLWYNLSDGIYIFDIGKNNVSSTVDNSQFIIDKTIEMIEYIPRTANFIVGGHYSNTDSTDMHRTVVEAVNLALKNKYGLKYFDINDILFSDATWTKLGLTKTAADIAAISQRRLPPSLSRDTAHLSPAMDIELALVIENKLTSLGYIT